MSQYHEILKVRPGASQEEIKSAFRKRALECHPDQAEEGRKEEAQEEFRRVREAFEVLTGEKEPRTHHTRRRSNTTAEEHTSRGAQRTRRSYKEEWRKYKDRRVQVGRDIVENVSGLSGEYERIRRKNTVTVPCGALLGGVLFLYNPMAVYGTGFFLVDVLLSSLVGGVYGFAAGSMWAYVELFLADFQDH